MTHKPLKVLIAEDDPLDAELLVRGLRDAGYDPVWRRVDTEADYLGWLDESVDLVLSDFKMPAFGGVRALELLKQRGLDIPLIIVSGTIGEDTAVGVMKLGAADYLLKDRLARLGNAVEQAIGQCRLKRDRKRAEDELAAERFRAEAARLESEIQFRQVVENIHEVFWISDPAERRILYVSPAYQAIWGRTCESLYADSGTWTDSIHPEDRDRVIRAAQTKQIEGDYDETYRVLQPGGAIRWIRDRAFPIRNAGGVVYRIVGTAEDVTDYRALEEQFRQAQKMEAIGTLAGGIAHDFNNILAAINGYTELARMLDFENEEMREYLDGILQASNRAGELVRQILAFGRRQTQEQRPMALRPAVAETMKLLRATIPSTIQFEIALANDAPVVLADATQVHQVLMNLGTNAWHAMRDRAGRLQVTLERFAVDTDLAATDARLRPGVYARLSVADTGCGMDPATMRRIFEPFFTTKPSGEGTGLGLSVVHGIMHSHDGAITVFSQPGEGAVFHLYFPAYAGDAAAPSKESLPAIRGSGESVLFVDDEELLVRLGTRTLAALGYRVEATTKASVALERVRASPDLFDVIMTDQTMPEMTGLELSHAIRQIRPDLPVILMTGYSSTLTTDRIKTAGIGRILDKPATVGEIAAAVHEALHGDSHESSVTFPN